MASRTERPRRLPWVLLAAVAVLAGCGSRLDLTTATSSPPALTTSPPALTTSPPAPTTVAISATTEDATTATKEITAIWERFFDAHTPLAARQSLLEDGDKYAAALQSLSQGPLMRQASAIVKTVVIDSPTSATVTYDVLLNGAIALPNATGQAVRRASSWQVSAASFCALVALNSPTPVAGCA